MTIKESITMEYSRAWEIHRRELEIAIEKQFGIEDFSFHVKEGDDFYLSLSESDVSDKNVQKALNIDADETSLDDSDLLEDYAHELIQKSTGYKILRVVLMEEGSKVLLLS